MKTTVKKLRENIKRFLEDVDRERRLKHGYGEDPTVDYGDLPEVAELEPEEEIEDAEEKEKDTEDDMEVELETEPKEDEKTEEEPNKEGVSQSKRARHGYALEMPIDYDSPGEGIPVDMETLKSVVEVAPPSEAAEEFIKANKDDFKKRYGARWREVLYKTAWKKFDTKKETAVKEAEIDINDPLAQTMSGGSAQVQKPTLPAVAGEKPASYDAVNKQFVTMSKMLASADLDTRQNVIKRLEQELAKLKTKRF